jgi:hypothetical protein
VRVLENRGEGKDETWSLERKKKGGAISTYNRKPQILF